MGALTTRYGPKSPVVMSLPRMGCRNISSIIIDNPRSGPHSRSPKLAIRLVLFFLQAEVKLAGW